MRIQILILGFKGFTTIFTAFNVNSSTSSIFFFNINNNILPSSRFRVVLVTFLLEVLTSLSFSLSFSFFTGGEASDAVFRTSFTFGLSCI